MKKPNYVKYLTIILLLALATMFTHCKGKGDNSVRELSNETNQNLSQGDIDPQLDVDSDFEKNARDVGDNKSRDAQCKNSKILTIWLDTDGNGEKDLKLGEIKAFSGDLSSSENYDYYSASAHPVVGPNPQGFESHVFFYNGPDGLTFNFYHNVDEGGSSDNKVEWNIQTSGNNLLDDFILVDDPSEYREPQVNEQSKIIDYQAYFRYWYNTDGAIIGPFQGNTFEIKVSSKVQGDNIDAAFYDADGGSFSLLNPNSPDEEISDFIITHWDVCI